MDKKCTLRMSWIIQIEKNIYNIAYEDYRDEMKHYLIINDKKEELKLPVSLRNREYDFEKNPYEYKFEIEELELTLLLGEDYVVLVVLGINVARRRKHLSYHSKFLKMMRLFGWFFFLFYWIASFIIVYFKNHNTYIYEILSIIFGIIFLSCTAFLVYVRIKYKDYYKEIPWIRDEKERLIQFKKSVDKHLDDFICEKRRPHYTYYDIDR